ncbi:MAG: arginine--tRNA ligase [Nanoarchaeota archaeon]|nr:arginine--tRNA ligase [Nanoarchaeota archaeon]
MKTEVVIILKKALDELNVEIKEEEISKFLEIPPTSDMGDYAFPCFFLSSRIKKNPHEIAVEIREKLGNFSTELFEDIQTSGPYINFFINRKELAKNVVNQILTSKDKFGKTDIGKRKKALIEHTSINPNASPHVGRTRNAIIADSIVRIMTFLNFKPEVHYYVNDVSKQIAMLVLAKAENLKFESMLKKYIAISTKVKNSKKAEKQVFDLLYEFENGNKKVSGKFKKITKTCVNGQKKILAELGIHYDFFDYESKYLRNYKGILSKLEATKKLFKDKDKRIIFNLKGTPIENQMKSPVIVLTRSDGTGLYPLRDLLYTIDKMKIAEKNLIVLGEDQKLYFQQIKQILNSINITSPEVVHYSFVLIQKKGKSKKMSTRKGDIVLLKDFLDEVIKKAQKELDKRKTKADAKKIGVGAVKYAILKNNNNKIINFDLEKALNFEGDTGPYILYSYARANSILKKIKNPKNKKIEMLSLEKPEIDLVKKLSIFPDIVLNSYKNLNPSLIANYSYQLSKLFNEFYHACPVIKSEQKSFRIALVQAFKHVLGNSLNLLGIDKIDRM